MKRSLSSLITDTNVREYNVREINVQNISESNSQARTTFDENKLNELKKLNPKKWFASTTYCSRSRAK